MNFKLSMVVFLFWIHIELYSQNHCKIEIQPNLFEKIDSSKSISELNKILKVFFDQYQIKVYTSSFVPSNYAKQYAVWEHLSNQDLKALKRYVKIFISEWKKYPPDWIIKANLKAIAFVKNLFVVGQKRAAMPDAYGEVLYYDIGYEMYGEPYERNVIHHEFYHMIEENYFGTMYYKDPEWQNLNPPNFTYGMGGANAYNDDPYLVHKEHPIKGFVNGYSTYGLEEDKAEVFSWLLIKNSRKKILQWSQSDMYLSNKVQYLKNFIKQNTDCISNEFFDGILID